MSETIKIVFVKPTTDPGPRLPLNPSQRFPQEGVLIVADHNVRRWLRRGDLKLAEAPTAVAKAAPKRTANQEKK